MRRWFVIWLLGLALLLPGCRRDTDEENRPGLNIAVEFPQQTSVKAGLEAFDEENAIHSLAIWVFRSDDHTPVASKLFTTAEDLPAGGGVKWYTLDVSWDFVNNHPDVDIFALANAASIGCTLDAGATYDQLTEAVFGYEEGVCDYFGTTSLTTSVDASLGLPFSGMKTQMTVHGTSPRLKVDAITLKRAVSRLRIVLCKTKTEGEEQDVVSIKGITFYKEQIPKKEYVFTESATGIVLDQAVYAQNFMPDPFSFNGPAQLMEHEAPQNLIYVNQDPSTYQAMLNQAVSDGTLSDLGYTYLRESNERLVGRIDYTVNGKDRFREFSTPAKGDFARNHTWTLFAYFMSGRNVQLSLVALPWDKGDYRVDFSAQAITVISKFVVDESSGDISYNDGFVDVKLIPGVAVKGHLAITTPVGGTLMIYPQGAATLFTVSPEQAFIDPDNHGGRIDIEIRNNPSVEVNVSELPASETTLTLSFSVEAAGREMDANTEVIDNNYRFHL